MSYRMSAKIDKKNNTDLTTISSCRYNNLEISLVVGDILMSNTTGIGAICDSRFTCTSGLAKHLKDAIGNDFTTKLQRAQQRQQNSSAIAISKTRNNNVHTDYIIFAPTRNADRHSLQTIYITIIDKAKELKLESLTIPFLGTGQLGLNQNEAGKYLLLAFSQITTFGSLQKLQFIDRSEGHMAYLRNLLTNKVPNVDVNQNQHVIHHQSSSRQQQRQKLQPYFIPDSNKQAIDTGSQQPSTSASSSSLSSTKSSSQLQSILKSNFDMDVTINITSYGTNSNDENDNGDISSNDSVSMFSESSESSEESDRSIGNWSTDSFFDVASGMGDDDAGFSTDSNDVNDTSIDLDDLVNGSQSGATETTLNEKRKKKRSEEEEKFWTIVPIENLFGDDSSQQSSQVPSTSKNAETKQQHYNPNVVLNDSTIPCSICLSDLREETDDVNDAVIQLSLCSHMFHQECIRAAFKVKKQCPLCMCWYGSPIGIQPKDATMVVRQIPGIVEGHSDANGFHEILYNIPSGIQSEGHIRPGEPYRGTTRIAYLPNNKEGSNVLKLLQLAFKRRLIFTIGDSITTGRKNVPVWNGIHHKTNKDGGSRCYGYPDAGYLDRVKEELALVGVRSEELNN